MTSKGIRITVALLALWLAVVGVALAADLTLDQVDGTWANASGDSGTPSCVYYNNSAVPTDENQVSYGRWAYWTGSEWQDYGCPGSMDLTKQSGFGFDGVDGAAFDFGEEFLLGEFKHYNRAIFAPDNFTQVDLDVTLDFSDPDIDGTFGFVVELDETNNNPDNHPGDVCPYGGDASWSENPPRGCNDRVYFPNTSGSQTITIGNTEYTLQISGFTDTAAGTCPATPQGAPINEFITEEGLENIACLYGRVTEYTPTAVDLASFTAELQGDAVMLSWETATELDSLGFNLYRAESLAGPRARLNAALIPTQSPGSVMGAAYEFVDDSVTAGASYHYWLEDVDASGEATLHGPASVEASPTARLLLLRPRPAAAPVMRSR